MANEAVLRKKFSDPVDFTCADGTGIEKGTLLKWSGDNTVAAATADGDMFAGVAAHEKIASDGRTQIGVYLDGIFDMTVDGTNTATLGYPQKIDGANLISDADDDTAEGAGEWVGKAIEAGSTSEVIRVIVGRF